nr:uncharacterized protein LOC115264131 [Aedes albopictus]
MEFHGICTKTQLQLCRNPVRNRFWNTDDPDDSLVKVMSDDGRSRSSFEAPKGEFAPIYSMSTRDKAPVKAMENPFPPKRKSICMLQKEDYGVCQVIAANN